MEKKLAPTRASASKTLFAAFKILNEELNNGVPRKELLNRIENTVTLTDYEKECYTTNGRIRWRSIFAFYSINCTKAGYIVKKNGIWYLTPDGADALKEGEEKLFEKINAGYRKWAKEDTTTLNNNDNDSDEETVIEESEEVERDDDLSDRALEGLSNYVNSQKPYDMQELVAALLRGMGYYTPFVAPPGKDGGVDIIAYKDPLGTTTPRILVQVKHRNDKSSPSEIRALMGLLQKDGDVGIFVSTGGFSAEAKATARSSNTHVELIDLKRFIELWQDFYNNLADQDKNLFPLKPIWFLDLKG